MILLNDHPDQHTHLCPPCYSYAGELQNIDTNCWHGGEVGGQIGQGGQKGEHK